MLKEVDAKELAEMNMLVNEASLDALVFPMFRVPKEKWESFYGGYDIYNKLVVHIKKRRESIQRYAKFL
jgi:hypothetical protein